VVAPTRPGFGHRRGGRRSERHRDVFAGRREVRIRNGVISVPVLTVMMLLAGNARVMGEFVSSPRLEIRRLAGDGGDDGASVRHVFCD
jgi:hypothetical protein